MALRYKIMTHRTTGQSFIAPSGRYGNFLSACRRLVKYCNYNWKKNYYAHLTLTPKENLPSIDTIHLKRVLNMIRMDVERSGGEVKYIAVKEVQKRGAMHFHVLIAYNKPYALPSWDRIVSSWRKGVSGGGAYITHPKLSSDGNRIAAYIGKYIGKGFEYEALEEKKSFTASSVPSMYKLAEGKLQDLIKRWGVHSAKFFRCTYSAVFTGPKWCEKEIMAWPKEWSCYAVVGEPF